MHLPLAIAALAREGRALRWDPLGRYYEVLDGPLFAAGLDALRRRRPKRSAAAPDRPFARMHTHFVLARGERWAGTGSAFRPRPSNGGGGVHPPLSRRWVAASLGQTTGSIPQEQLEGGPVAADSDEPAWASHIADGLIAAAAAAAAAAAQPCVVATADAGPGDPSQGPGCDSDSQGSSSTDNDRGWSDSEDLLSLLGCGGEEAGGGPGGGSGDGGGWESWDSVGGLGGLGGMGWAGTGTLSPKAGYLPFLEFH